MNACFMNGNLVADPVCGESVGGVKYATFRIGVRRSFKNADGNYDSDFFNCVAWRGAAEIVRKDLKKGDRVTIQGAVQNRTYEDKDGVKHYTVEIIVSEVATARVKNGMNEQVPPPEPPPDNGGFTETDDELPF